MHLKIPSAKWRPFCPGVDELNHHVKHYLVDGYLRQEASILFFFYKIGFIFYHQFRVIMQRVVSGQVGLINTLWPGDNIYRYTAVLTLIQVKPSHEPMLPSC